MIKRIQGNILFADTDAIVNTVNCVGVMGRGIALQFKKSWPDNFKMYAKACKKYEVKPGEMFIFETGQLTKPYYIINFPTKRHWRAASRIEDIEAGLVGLVKDIKRLKIKSIAIPPLGAGLGGLDWLQVREKIETAMRPLDNVEVVLYEPLKNLQNNKAVKQKNMPNMTLGRAVLIELMQRYLKGLLDPSISLLEVHKLLYFMQEAGEPLSLRYEKAPYGPYAENLRHVLNVIEGHFIHGYSDGGDMPKKELHLIPSAIKKAKQLLDQHPETKERFERVSRLVNGFESSKGLELLSTVHWLNCYENKKNTTELIKATHSWNQRKKQFTARQIILAEKVLKDQTWISSNICTNNP